MSPVIWLLYRLLPRDLPASLIYKFSPFQVGCPLSLGECRSLSPHCNLSCKVVLTTVMIKEPHLRTCSRSSSCKLLVLATLQVTNFLIPLRLHPPCTLLAGCVYYGFLPCLTLGGWPLFCFHKGRSLSMSLSSSGVVLLPIFLGLFWQFFFPPSIYCLGMSHGPWILYCTVQLGP